MTARTIICGVDSSSGGRQALKAAARLAGDLDARLLAVHICGQPATAAEARQRAEELIADLGSELGSELSATIIPRGEVGDPAERLAGLAQETDALMIVVGARGRGRSRTFLRSRLSAELADIAPVPLLIAAATGLAPESPPQTVASTRRAAARPRPARKRPLGLRRHGQLPSQASG